MSLELFARHIRDQIDEFNFKSTKQEVTQIPEEQTILKNPFLTLEDIFNDALPSVDSNKFYSISFVGSQGHGKTFSAEIVASLADHKDFLVIYGKAEDFMEDKKAWVEQVKQKIKDRGTIWVCFVLDDMSYSTAEVSAKKSAGFKHFIADIRHVLEPVLGDIKILMIYISHRLHSLPPMLRNSGTWIFASMLPEDRADAMKLIPKSKEERDRLDSMFKFLQWIQNEGPKKDVVHMTLRDKPCDFVWGKQGRPGDGRLMMVSHAGEMKILQSKGIENMIDLEATRIHPITLDNLEEDRNAEEDLDRLKAEALRLFPKPKDEFEELKHILPITKQSEHLLKIKNDSYFEKGDRP